MSRTTGSAPSGWYADPASRFPHRYWDGRWTAGVLTPDGPVVDPLGAPVNAGPPAVPPAGATAAAWARAHRRPLTVAAAALAVLVLVTGSAVVVQHRIDDVRDDARSEQRQRLDKVTANQNEALNDAADRIDEIESQLSDVQSELDDVRESQTFGGFDPDGGPLPLSKPCELLTAGDIRFVLGTDVTVQPLEEPDLEDFGCFLTSGAGSAGLGVLVYSDSLAGLDLRDVVFPLTNEKLAPLAVGEEGLGTVAFGVAHGASAKDGLFVELIVTGGTTPATIEQLQVLLTTAVARLR
jgi:hypothetical protein